MDEETEVGRFTGNPDGVINEAVNMKKINNRNTMSVIDDMLNVESILCFDLISIFWFTMVSYTRYYFSFRILCYLMIQIIVVPEAGQ